MVATPAAARYFEVRPLPSVDQLDPLGAVVDLSLPASVRTVGEALALVLGSSGYRLPKGIREQAPLRRLLALPVPAPHRAIRNVRLDQAVAMMVAPAYRPVVDPVHRLIGFELDEAFEGMVPAPDAAAEPEPETPATAAIGTAEELPPPEGSASPAPVPEPSETDPVAPPAAPSPAVIAESPAEPATLPSGLLQDTLAAYLRERWNFALHWSIQRRFRTTYPIALPGSSVEADVAAIQAVLNRERSPQQARFALDPATDSRVVVATLVHQEPR